MRNAARIRDPAIDPRCLSRRVRPCQSCLSPATVQANDWIGRRGRLGRVVEGTGRLAGERPCAAVAGAERHQRMRAPPGFRLKSPSETLKGFARKAPKRGLRSQAHSALSSGTPGRFQAKGLARKCASACEPEWRQEGRRTCCNVTVTEAPTLSSYANKSVDQLALRLNGHRTQPICYRELVGNIWVGICCTMRNYDSSRQVIC